MHEAVGMTIIKPCKPSTCNHATKFARLLTSSSAARYLERLDTSGYLDIELPQEQHPKHIGNVRCEHLRRTNAERDAWY